MGKGKNDRTCPECGGAGWIYDYIPDPQNPRKTKRIVLTCHTCKGRGTI